MAALNQFLSLNGPKGRRCRNTYHLQNPNCLIDRIVARHIFVEVRERVPIWAAYGRRAKKTLHPQEKSTTIELPEWADFRTIQLDMYGALCVQLNKLGFS